MNKSQRNKKEIKQNTRNKISNRHYKSTVKNLLKLFRKKVVMQLSASTIEKEALFLNKDQLFLEAKRLQKAIYSAVDKAAKKGVIHRNSASRKKSTIGLFCGSLLN